MHQYYYGGEQASLEAADVDAAWKSEPRALALLNKAFEIYYDACNSIKQVDDVEMRQKLALSLDKAAKYWYPLYSGFGKVNTLVGAFEHLDKNSGRWTDNNTGSYNGGVGGTGWVQNVPSCAASFLRAVDENIETLRECLENFAHGLSQMKEGEDNSAWEKVGKGLEGSRNMESTSNHYCGWRPKRSKKVAKPCWSGTRRSPRCTAMPASS